MNVRIKCLRDSGKETAWNPRRRSAFVQGVSELELSATASRSLTCCDGGVTSLKLLNKYIIQVTHCTHCGELLLNCLNNNKGLLCFIFGRIIIIIIAVVVVVPD
jgi:hypothetical protein